jgi:3',5'-cyclic-AMP phosphodiesterase
MPIHLPPISRRRFLAGSLAAGAGMLLPQRLWAKEKKPAADPNRFLLLSDIHIPGGSKVEQNGVKPVDFFMQAVKEALELKPRPVGAIVSGDCAFLEGKAEDYRKLRELIQPLRRAGMAVHFAMGNHDDRRRFLAAFPEAGQQAAAGTEKLDKFISVLETPHADWFLLDSSVNVSVTHGLLGEAQLAWLAKALDARKDKPAFVVTHHDPARPVKNNELKDPSALLDVVMPRKQVKAYFFGHTHQWHHSRMAGLHLINIPTTAWLFDKKQPRGFVTADLRADGATLALHSLDPNHPKHGEKVELAWR